MKEGCKHFTHSKSPVDSSHRHSKHPHKTHTKSTPFTADNKILHSNSGQLVLDSVIGEALHIRKRVDEILAFNEFCSNYGMTKPKPRRQIEDPLETDIDLLNNKIDDMEKIISQQRLMNDQLRRKLQSQEFDSGSGSREVGKFTKPQSRGIMSTNRDTDHLTTSRLSEEVGLKNRNLKCRSDNASVRKSIDSSNREAINRILMRQQQKANTQNNTVHQQQLQILNQQFQNLMMKQGTTTSQAERTKIRSQLIQVSQRINQLSQHKTRTYHL